MRRIHIVWALLFAAAVLAGAAAAVAGRGETAHTTASTVAEPTSAASTTAAVSEPPPSEPPLSEPAPPATGTLLVERFTANRRDWPESTSPYSRLVVRGGGYRIAVTTPNGFEQPTAELSAPAAGVELDAVVEQHGRLAGAGLSCLDSSGTGLEFLIDAPTGRYSVWAATADAAFEVTRGRSDRIHRQGRNRLHAVCGAPGDAVVLAVNGSRLALVSGAAEIAELTGQSYAPGPFATAGLPVEAGRSSGAVVYDDLVVRATG